MRWLVWALVSAVVLLVGVGTIQYQEVIRAELYASGTAHPSTTYSSAIETFCVQNVDNYPGFDAGVWQGTIGTWLADPNGWRGVGSEYIQFAAAACDTAVTRIRFVNPAGPNWQPCAGIACGPYVRGTTTTIHGHGHPTGADIQVNVVYWLTLTDTERRGVLNHEMGHVLGLDHGGPQIGVVTVDDEPNLVYDGADHPNPSPHEKWMVRYHLQGGASAGVGNSICVGFPEAGTVQVSWLDAAVDETRNFTDLWRWEGGNWVYKSTPATGSVAGFGGHVILTFRPTDASGDWIGNSGVQGGPLNVAYPNPSLWPPSATWTDGVPHAPCTLRVNAIGSGGILMEWVDGSFNETGFDLWYSTKGSSNVAHSAWTWAGTCPGHSGVGVVGCVDYASRGYFSVGSITCVAIQARGLQGGFPVGSGRWSNASCTLVR